MADEKFGVDGWKTVEVPSEAGKDLGKNYLRHTQLSQSPSPHLPHAVGLSLDGMSQIL
jgi:hypothetical protein